MTDTAPRSVKRVKVHDPKYDTTFKILFGGEDNRRTISLLNSVYGFEGDDEIVEIEIDFTPPTDLEIQGMGRSIIFDVRCRDRSGNNFIIEMQKGSCTGYMDRAVYYGAKVLTREGNALWRQNKEEYEAARKAGQTDVVNKNRSDLFYKSLPRVHVLSILDYIIFPDSEEYNHPCGIKSERGGAPLSRALSWRFVELGKFKKQDRELTNTLEYWLYLLSRNDEEIVELDESITGNDVVIEEAYERLACLTDEEEILVEDNMQREMDAVVYYGGKAREAVEEAEEKAEKAEKAAEEAEEKAEKAEKAAEEAEEKAEKAEKAAEEAEEKAEKAEKAAEEAEEKAEKAEKAAEEAEEKAEKAEKRGIEKGMLEAKCELAKNLFAMGLSIDDVSKGAGLPIAEVERLSKEQK